MKKKISEINGLILSNKQMKELKGGRIIVGGTEKKACGTTCSVNASYKCATNAMNACVCGGATADGGFSVGACAA